MLQIKNGSKNVFLHQSDFTLGTNRKKLKKFSLIKFFAVYGADAGGNLTQSRKIRLLV
jgi:hypothetical protein